MEIYFKKHPTWSTNCQWQSPEITKKRGITIVLQIKRQKWDRLWRIMAFPFPKKESQLFV